MSSTTQDWFKCAQFPNRGPQSESFHQHLTDAEFLDISRRDPIAKKRKDDDTQRMLISTTKVDGALFNEINYQRPNL